MEQIWTFMQTIGKGIIQGTTQFIQNDLRSYVPLIIFAAFILVIQLKVIIKKIKNKKQ